jgi:hypothetical protein
MSNGLPWGESPVDITGDEPEWASSLLPTEQTAKSASYDLVGLGWITRILLQSSVLLMLFNSHAIANWANRLPITDKTAFFVNAAQQWHATTNKLRLNAVVDLVEREANVFRSDGWGEKLDHHLAK